MPGWNGLSIAVAQQILSAVQVQIERNADEGCIIATHPNTKQIIRKRTVTKCVETVLQEWMVLK